MTGELSKNFHGVGIGPLSKILAVKCAATVNKIEFSVDTQQLKNGILIASNH